ncbi:MAG: ABC transporter ATP-binding protein [Bacteroidales bacterium]|jgi:ABC-2 type transport system ATP-binding protein|nr:ABC transporter ATP-binding protein [Bacteroidales bacterium]
MSEIRIENISKNYGKVQAVKNVSFSVKSGELFGLIGPDGAGKSSLIRIITSLLLPDSGNIQLGEYDVVKDYKIIRRLIGYMPGKFSLYQDLTVKENLEFFATVFGSSIEENYDLIKDIYHQIEPFKNRRAGKLSGGMKQKLALSCALIHKPEFLILDEPTTGVDAVSRAEFWDMLDRLKSKGISILASTPYMDEAMRCDRIALMQKGEILGTNKPSEISKMIQHDMFGVRADDMYKLKQFLSKCIDVDAVNLFGQEIHISLKTGINETSIREKLALQGFSNLEFRQIEAEIEDVFIHLMTRQAKEVKNDQ